MARKTAKRTVVGEPLCPAVLKEIGAFRELPTAPVGSRPEGEWVATYRIWTCHGYRESGNADKGFLRVRRARRAGAGAGADEGFTLAVDQQIFNDGGQVHVVHADIECAADPRASLARWTLTSRFVGPDGRERAGLACEQRGRVEGDRIRLRTNGRDSVRPGSRRLTADWCLFEAVGRAPRKTGEPIRFDLLEGLSLLRPDHRLSYRGRYRMPGGADGPRLHWFQQIGRGMLPYEYWLDDRHRVLMAATFSRVYLLDEQAEAKVRRAAAARRRAARRRAAAPRTGATR